jgi:hypothetical protein
VLQTSWAPALALDAWGFRLTQLYSGSSTASSTVSTPYPYAAYFAGWLTAFLTVALAMAATLLLTPQRGIAPSTRARWLAATGAIGTPRLLTASLTLLRRLRSHGAGRHAGYLLVLPASLALLRAGGCRDDADLGLGQTVEVDSPSPCGCPQQLAWVGLGLCTIAAAVVGTAGPALLLLLLLLLLADGPCCLLMACSCLVPVSRGARQACSLACSAWSATWR